MNEQIFTSGLEASKTGDVATILYVVCAVLLIIIYFLWQKLEKKEEKIESLILTNERVLTGVNDLIDTTEKLNSSVQSLTSSLINGIICKR